MPAIRILAGVTAAVCLGGLALQAWLIVQATDALAASGALKFPALAAGAVFFSFLTLQINLVAALVTTSAAANLKRFNRDGRLRSAIAAYLAAGSIIYALALQPYWHHTGAQFVADALLHGVAPVLYAAFWMVAVPKAPLRWRDPFRWLIYPGIYLAVILFAAQWTGFYPYPFIDVRTLSFLSLLFNLLALGITFLSSGLAMVAAAHILEPPKA